MTGFKHLSLRIDEHGIATVIIDAAGRSMNVFDDEMLLEMEHVVTQLDRQPGLTLIVFRSGKASGFIAGADVGRIQSIPSREVALELAHRGQQLFDRIENLPAPTVAIIHGPCLGGGLEFALACRYRIAIDTLSTRIGLPETQLGLIPGWGGTQRLPRTVGLKAAVSLILEGKRLTATEAARFGLIDATVAEADAERELPRL
ncbi:MAG: enoyl-CoA hydratase/isomerase family protein, partial [Planctomycetaceae bacterium]|nr:enoyl-CoA hydratase/isomerase family protein [Planctomycetaceae bacterium]